MKYLFVLAVLSFAFFGCKKTSLQSERDEEEISNYIAQKGLVATKTESGMYVVVNEKGAGGPSNSSSNVKVVYKGYFTDGTVFDESAATGASFNLANTIAGWQEGIPFFNEGGNGILLIPSRLGYGEKGSGKISGSKVLVFDIKLVDVF